jgi:glycosyltransferase involved in cell wall biosynthesis
MAAMHVAVASHYRLPVAGYGGSQRVVVALVRGLVARGHRVTLLAQPGTKVPEAKLVEVPPRDLKNPSIDLTPYIPADTDILHVHFPVKRPTTTVPFVQTLHGNLNAKTAVPPNNIFLSRDHARRYGSESFVYNGLDPAEFTFRKRKEQWDLFLGRLHSTKGYHWAVEAAKKTGRKLIIAGGWRPSFTANVKYVGEVDGGKKRALLARARCLWMAALWDEPFGLTTIEALFSGTPVLGTRRGALPELVTPEVGALADTLDGLIEASRTIGTRSPEACRAHAERHFTHLVMAAEYERMYRGMLETGRLPPGQPAHTTT